VADASVVAGAVGSAQGTGDTLPGCGHLLTWRRPRSGRGDLEIGGITPLTTIDFPGRLAAVVFCQGCPWRCRYCQNTHLLPSRAERPVAWEDVAAFLDRRRGLLDGVVFSGGEPTAQAALPEALREVRAMGFATGLHTAGAYPERLAAVLPLLAWVGVDIKAPRSAYGTITCSGPVSGDRAWESLGVVLASGVACEVRTTVHPDLLDPGGLLALAEDLACAGVRDYVLQECVTGRCLDPSLTLAVGQRALPMDVIERIAPLFPRFAVRRP
jgi:pyruvate formate lyase activating enzyme